MAGDQTVLMESEAMKVVTTSDSSKVRFELFNTTKAIDLYAQRITKQTEHMDNSLALFENILKIIEDDADKENDNETRMDGIHTPRVDKKIGRLKRRAETPVASSAIKNKIVIHDSKLVINSSKPRGRKLFKADAGMATEMTIDQGTSNPKNANLVAQKSSIAKPATRLPPAGANDSFGNTTRVTRAQAKRNAAQDNSGCTTFIASTSSVTTPKRNLASVRMSPARKQKEAEEKKKKQILLNSQEKVKRAEMNKQAHLQNRAVSIREAREKRFHKVEIKKKEEPKEKMTPTKKLLRNNNNNNAVPKTRKEQAQLVYRKQMELGKQQPLRAPKNVYCGLEEVVAKKDATKQLLPSDDSAPSVDVTKNRNFVDLKCSLDKEDQVLCQPGAPNGTVNLYSPAAGPSVTMTHDEHPTAFSRLLSPILKDKVDNIEAPVPFKSPAANPEWKFASQNGTYEVEPSVPVFARSSCVAQSNLMMGMSHDLMPPPKTPLSNKTVTKLINESHNVSNYQMTPPPPDVSYNISTFIDSDDEDPAAISAARKDKKIPSWALHKEFLRALRDQFSLPQDQLQAQYEVDFGDYVPILPVPIDQMGLNIRDAYRIRSSSVNWMD